MTRTASTGRGGGGGGRQAPRVAVLGAGPVGLEAALAARERGLPVTVYEAGPAPAANVRGWGHVRLFTPWEMNVSERMRRALGRLGRPLEVEGAGTHTGAEYVERVLDPLWAELQEVGSLRLGAQVVAVGREGILKHEEIGTPERGRRAFRILVESAEGAESVEHAEIVLDCTGKYGNPNPLGNAGIPAPGERRLEGRIRRSIPDLEREADDWRGRTVLVAGGGHSAQTAVRALAGLGAGTGTRVLWLMRGEGPSAGSPPDDPLPLRRELARDARALATGGSPIVEPLPGRVVEALEADNGSVRVRLARPELAGGGGAGAGGRARDAASGERDTLRVERILSLTGGVGDHSIYRQLQVHECYATSGPMKLSAALLGSASDDCLAQESQGADVLANPEPGFFILGDKSYGRNNTFLLRTGFAQVEEVFGAFLP